MSSWGRYIFAIFGFTLGSVLTSLLLINREVVDTTVILSNTLSSIPVPPTPNVTNLSPIIFVGGFPRSGTTLMRVLLEAHPDVRCGPETRVIPNVLSLHHRWTTSSSERRRLADAGLLGEPIDKAMAAFILEIIRRNGRLTPRLCNKDPLALRHMIPLTHFFPNSKFVLMIRDGRAVTHSIVKRHVTIRGVNMNDPMEILKKWDSASRKMLDHCDHVNKMSTDKRCLKVFYEELVLHPEQELRQIASFLKLSWTPNFLKHDHLMKNDSKSFLSRSEKSTDQVVHPINIKSLTEWCSDGVLSQSFIYNAQKKSSLLKFLNYDVDHIPPFYGVADSLVRRNTDRLTK